MRVWLREVDPASAEPLAAAPRARGRRRSGGVTRVLLVEDEPAIRSLARAALEEAGFEVLEASSGEDAVARSEREREQIHILVSDVVLGRLTGDHLALVLRRRWPNLRVVLMSGYTERSLALEPDAFLEKPLALDELTTVVTAQAALA
jgi:DNA-binding response OmpR family regulator